MNAQVVAINAGKGGYQMQRWNYIESTFLDKSSWCLFNNYAISRAIGFQNIIIMSRARLAASLVSDSASVRDPSNSWWKPSAATCTPPPLHHVNTTRQQGPSGYGLILWTLSQLSLVVLHRGSPQQMLGKWMKGGRDPPKDLIERESNVSCSVVSLFHTIMDCS